jgi:hypothetical protein
VATSHSLFLHAELVNGYRLLLPFYFQACPFSNQENWGGGGAGGDPYFSFLHNFQVLIITQIMKHVSNGYLLIISLIFLLANSGR